MIARCPSCFQEYDAEYGMCPSCGFSVEDQRDESHCLLVGTEIAGRYVIGGMLGLGGFGITYRAWDKKLETIVAIKEYFPSGMVNRLPGTTEVMLVASKRQQEVQYGKDRFLDEARNLARFNTHPSIVNVFDYFEANNTAYIVMEYLDGKTLSRVVRDQGKPLAAETCVNIAHNVCEALHAIHADSILHRDVSPDNIFICNNGTVKLIDFGAARFSEMQDTRLTIVIKPGFAPPEQYERVNRQGPWTDVYALGATLYYALTGHRPLESTNRKIQDELLPPIAVSPNIPEYISAAVMRAMAIDIPYRYPNVDELDQALLRQKKVVSVEAVKKRKKTGRIASIGVAVIAVAVIFGAAGLIWQSRRTPTADLQLWYSLSGNEILDTEKKAALQTIVEQFEAEYKSISITLCGVEAERYQQALEEGQEDERPDLYESTELVLPDSADLSEMLDRLVIANGFVNVDMQEKLQYPTGIMVPILYVNTSIGEVSDFSTLEAVLTSCAAAESSLTVAQEFVNVYESLYGNDVTAYVSFNALKEFLQGQAMVYLGSTADYQVIRDSLPGLYTVHFPDANHSAYRYDCFWSVSQTDRQTERAALLALEYLTSDMAQDYLHIRRKSGAVPITENMLGEYEAVYPELSALSTFLEQPFAE